MTYFDGSGSESEEDVSKRTESEIVRWILSFPAARQLLLSELGLGCGCYVQAEIIEPLLDRQRGRTPGDIDLIILADTERCHEAVTIQAKRVPITAVSTEKDRIGKGVLGNLTGLVRQANGNRDLGFHQTYLMPIIQVYGVERSELNFASRGSSPGLFKRIYQWSRNQPVHDDVGVIFVEITQPTRSSVDRGGVIAVSVDRRARPLEQGRELTRRVEELVSKRRSL